MGYVYRQDGRRTVRLKDFDPSDRRGLKRVAAERKMLRLSARLTELQELLYASGQTSVLIVLQGMDTSGKDGTIRHVMGPLNPQGCNVTSFKVPTPVELAHDFLWRIHRRTPGRGQITIFNRSHYEDVLVVRVHDLVPRKVWSRRYEQINAFERLLVDSGTVVLKFFLHISREEQEQRLLDREKDELKYWKLSVGDWKERQHWKAYLRAYEDVLNKCSTPQAPWYIVPANRKWFRNLAVAQTIVDALQPFRKGWRKHLVESGRIELEKVRQFRESPGAPSS